MSSARRDIESTKKDLDDFSKSFSFLGTSIAAFGPAIAPVGLAVLGVGASLGTMTAAAGIAGGAYAFFMGNAIKSTLALAKAHKDLTPVQQTFVNSVNQMKSAMNGVSTSTMPLTLHTATIITQGLTAAIGQMTPLIRAVAPLADQVANSFKNWASGSGMKDFINLIIATGVPALKNLLHAGADVISVLGDGFRALAPTIIPMSKAISDGADAMKKWADAGGFADFLQKVHDNAPQIESFLKTLVDALVNVSKALAGMGPGALALLNPLLKLVAILPPSVIQAMVYAYIAWQVAMAGAAVAAYALGIALAVADAAATPFFLALAIAGAPLWLIVAVVLALVAVVAAFVVGLVELANHWDGFIHGMATAGIATWQALLVAWNATWNVMKVNAFAIWTAIQVSFKIFVDTFVAVFKIFGALFTGNWGAMWNAVKALGGQIWNGIIQLWNATIGRLPIDWTVIGNALKTAWNATWSALSLAASVAWNAMRAAWTAFINAMAVTWTTVSAALKTAWIAVWNAMNTAAMAVWNALKVAWTAFINAMNTTWTTVSAALKASWSAVWTAMSVAANAIWNALKAAWSAFLSAMTAAFTAFSGALKSAWSAMWSALQAAANAAWNALKAGWSALFSAMSSTFGSFSAALKSAWSGMWSAIQAAATAAWNAIKAGWSALFSAMSSAFASFSSALKTAWSGMWSAMESTAKTVWASIQAGFNALATGVEGTLTGLVAKAKATWDTITGIFKTPINAVIGIWNSVAGVFSLPKIPTLATGGMVDGPGLVKGPGGPTEDRVPAMLSNREFVVSADAVEHYGVENLWALNAKQLATGGSVAGAAPRTTPGGVPMLAIGGIIPSPGDIIGAIGGVLGSAAASALKDLLGDAFMKAVKPILDGFAPPDKNNPPGHGILSIPHAAYEKVETAVLGLLKTASAIGGVIPTGSRKAIIDAAMKAAGVPPPDSVAAWEAGMNTLITRESNWDSGAQNNSDSNAAAGTPSKGLAQVIQPTFNAYHVPGTSSNIFDPVANVAAAINYIVHVYGSIMNVQQANANLPPKGYWTGTPSAKSGWHRTGERGPEWVKFNGGEKVLPHGKSPDDDSTTPKGDYVHFDNGAFQFNFGPGTTKEAVQHVESELVPKLRMAVQAGVGKRCNP